MPSKNKGGDTDYYAIPKGAITLNDLIEHKKMNFALGNVFKACYRLADKEGVSVEYDLNKIQYYLDRLRAKPQNLYEKYKNYLINVK